MSFSLKDKIAAFKEACETGDTCVLDHMLYQKEFDVDERLPAYDKQLKIFGFDPKILPPWAIAVHYGSAPVLKWLLRNGATIMLFYYAASLPVAVSKRNPDLVKLMLKIGDEMSFVQRHDYVACFNAALYDLTQCDQRALTNEERNKYAQEIFDTMNVILESYAARVGNEDNQQVSEFRQILTLFKAVFENDLNKISEVLTNSCCSILTVYNPVSYSIKLNRPESTRLFAENGVSLEEIFFHSIKIWNKELVQLCLDKGYKPKEMSVFAEVCKYKNKDAFTFFIERYNFDPSTDFLRTILPSFKETDAEFLKTFLMTFPEIDINKPDKVGNTIIESILPCTIFETLLKFGIDPSIRRRGDGIPFHYCRDLNEFCNVIRYVEKMRIIDPVYIHNLIPKIVHTRHMSDWQELTIDEILDCKSELEQLKTIQISKKYMDQPSRTLFDFISFNPDKTARFARNEIILQLRQDCSGDFENKFKNYGCLINYKLRRGQKRRNLMDSARETLTSAMGTELPEELTNMIFQHLTDQKIEKLSQTNSQTVCWPPSKKRIGLPRRACVSNSVMRIILKKFRME